jgi:hypothetical protein
MVLSSSVKRMHRLVSLSLLRFLTYRAEAFFAPPRLVPQQRQVRSLHSTASSNLRELHFDTKIQQISTSPTDGITLPQENLQPVWKRFPSLTILAKLSSSITRSPTTTSERKMKNPLASFFATGSTTQSAPQLVISPLWCNLLGLIVFQGYGLQFLTLASILLKQLSAVYMTNLAAFPCITKSITSGVIGFFGDFMAQSLAYTLKNKKSKTKANYASLQDRLSIQGTYDLRRGLGIMIDGFFISGPLMHVGYDLFERILPIHAGAGSRQALAALAHVVADSLILDSIFVATAFVVTGIMEGYGFRKHIIPQFKRDYAPTLKAGWATSLTLMPLEFVCFRFLPVTLRTLAMNLTDVIWDGMISFMTHRNRNKKDLLETATTNEAMSYLGQEVIVSKSGQRQDNLLIKKKCPPVEKGRW